MGANEKHDAAFHGREGLAAELAAENAAKPPLQATVKPKPKPLGRVGQTILTVVSLAILAPFVGILWFWAVSVMQSLVR